MLSLIKIGCIGLERRGDQLLLICSIFYYFNSYEPFIEGEGLSRRGFFPFEAKKWSILFVQAYRR